MQPQRTNNMGKDEKDSIRDLGASNEKLELAATYSDNDKQTLSKSATIEEGKDIPQTLTTLRRQTNRNRNSVPGAHAVRGPGMADGESDAYSLSTTMSVDGRANPSSLTPTTSEDSGPVLTATLVEEDDSSPRESEDSEVFHVVQASPPPLARAEPADDLLADLEAATNRYNSVRDLEAKPSPKPPSKKRWVYFLLALSLLVISGLTVALVFSLRKPPPPPPDNKKKDGPGNNSGDGGNKGGNDDKFKPDLGQNSNP